MRISQILRVSLLTLCAVAFGRSANALPQYALKTGDASCRGCHTSSTGGGLRTDGGNSYMDGNLAMWKRGEKFSPTFGPGLRIGFDYRGQYLAFSATNTIYPRDAAGLVTTGATHDTTSTVSGMQLMSAPIYLSATLTKTLSAYVKWDPVVAATGTGVEAYGQLHFVHSSGEILDAGSVVGDAYIKLGAFEPNFGIRFDDHSIYTRGGNASLSGKLKSQDIQFGAAGMFWQPNYRDLGVELGGEFFDHLFVTLGYFNGGESAISSTFVPPQPGNFSAFVKPAMSATATFTTTVIEDVLSLQLGASAYMHPRTTADRFGVDSSVNESLVAVHGGARVGPVTLLAELDFGTQVYQPFDGIYHDKANAMVLDADVDLVKGLRVFGRYENFSDKGPADVLRTEVASRITVGATWYPLRYVSLQPELRMAKTSSLDKIDLTHRNESSLTTFLIQTHLYF